MRYVQPHAEVSRGSKSPLKELQGAVHTRQNPSLMLTFPSELLSSLTIFLQLCLDRSKTVSIEFMARV